MPPFRLRPEVVADPGLDVELSLLISTELDRRLYQYATGDQ